jgi:ATP-dependent Clp protease adapter protein ClpS
MAKQCPVNHTHKTVEKTFDTFSYDFCCDCKEDVEALAKKMETKIKDDEEPELRLNDQEQEDDIDDFEDLGDADDDDDGAQVNPFQNPPGWNANPQRNMGNAAGTHKIVLLNDNQTGQMVVEEVLRTVFHKDPVESNYIMNHAHYNGEAEVWFINPQDWPAMEQAIEQIKATWAQRFVNGGAPADHARHLRFELRQR